MKKILPAVILAIFSASAMADIQLKSDVKGVMNIKPTPQDTPAAKEFLKTGVNQYTAIYLKDKAQAQDGKKIFQMYGCIACHGGNAGGMTGPDLTDNNFNNSKIGTDVGMFEVIAGGTENGMTARHEQVANNPDLLSTDEILKAVAWIRSMSRVRTANR